MRKIKWAIYGTYTMNSKRSPWDEDLQERILL